MDVLGVTRVRNCCSFLWAQDRIQPRRFIFFRAFHCVACTGEMIRFAKLQRITLAGGIRMDRVRETLARQRGDLIDRWDRQLLAAAEAGFALDAETRTVLPRLLDATDRALERRFRAVSPGTPHAAAEAQRAAMQGSLLGDFLFDAALEQLPEMSVAEQRLMGAALGHAEVEVLVQCALELEAERRRRDNARLARLAHELRNQVTAARLAFDLLRRRGALPDSRSSRLLEQSLGRLRDGIDDSLLDEVLSSGGLRISSVRLAPLLANARSAAEELGAADKDLTVVLERPAANLSVRADRRMVRPAVRGLLRAAVELARRGAVIRVGADRHRDRAQVEVAVEGCRRLTGARLPDLPALAFARRAAKIHGGSLSTRLRRSEGCEFRLAFPCAYSLTAR